MDIRRFPWTSIAHVHASTSFTDKVAEDFHGTPVVDRCRDRGVLLRVKVGRILPKKLLQSREAFFFPQKSLSNERDKRS